jgi:hypothetical protein
MDKFYLFRSTTDRITGHLEHIEESGDTVLGMAFLGGEKHWIIVCRRGHLVVRPPVATTTSGSVEHPHPPGLRRVGAVPREQPVTDALHVPVMA